MSAGEKEDEIFRIYNEIVKTYKAICEERKYSAEELLNFAAHNYIAYIGMKAQIWAQGVSSDSKQDTIINYLNSTLNNMEKRSRTALSTSGVELGIDFTLNTIINNKKEKVRKDSSKKAADVRYEPRRKAKKYVLEAWGELTEHQKQEKGKAEFGREMSNHFKDKGLEIPATTISRTWLR